MARTIRSLGLYTPKYLTPGKTSLTRLLSLHHAGPISRLKDWLDPANTGQITLQTAKADCSDIVGIDELQAELDNSVIVYPNPSLTGTVWIKVNLADVKDVTVAVMDIKGVQVANYTLGKVISGTYTMNLSGLANGLYLLKFTTNDNVSVSKKVLMSTQ